MNALSFPQMQHASPRSAILLLMIIIGFATACQKDKSSEQRYPEGVTRAEYQKFPTDGSQFSSARLAPPFWWTQMADPEVEVTVYDENIAFWTPSVEVDYVVLDTVYRVENPNYLFCRLYIANDAPSGTFDLIFTRGDERKTKPFTLKERNQASNWIDPVNTSDVVYLIMPDRFSDGDEYNDTVPPMRQLGVDRSKMYFRHGGDIQGIINHLDYLKELGISALWLNPVMENDQPYESYHGYAITDHYQVDPRLGTNDLYIKLSEICREKDLHIIKDLVFNHVGDYHWFIRDLPDPNWIHQPDSFVQTTYRIPTLMDPHASEADQKKFQQGWFDHHMPDLNQQHPRLARYLIQNTIWWIENAGIDGLRLDTYAYADQAFMAEWAIAVRREYPDLYIYGETWVHGPGIQSYFQPAAKKLNHNAPDISGLTDFQLHYSILEGLKQEQGWTSGLSRVYYTLAQDYLYDVPDKHLIFLDNHDLSRFYSVLDESYEKYEQALAMLFTMRGVPSIYYGTEILMKNMADPDVKVRMDFPGGWEGDPVNKFLPDERSKKENRAWNFVSNLAHLRQNEPALQTGKLIQFVPEDDVYVYFRVGDTNCFMIAVNNNRSRKDLELMRFDEILSAYPVTGNIIRGEITNDRQTLEIDGNGFALIEWKQNE